MLVRLSGGASRRFLGSGGLGGRRKFPLPRGHEIRSGVSRSGRLTHAPYQTMRPERHLLSGDLIVVHNAKKNPMHSKSTTHFVPQEL